MAALPGIAFDWAWNIHCNTMASLQQDYVYGIQQTLPRDKVVATCPVGLYLNSAGQIAKYDLQGVVHSGSVGAAGQTENHKWQRTIGRWMLTFSWKLLRSLHLLHLTL